MDLGLLQMGANTITPLQKNWLQKCILEPIVAVAKSHQSRLNRLTRLLGEEGGRGGGGGQTTRGASRNFILFRKLNRFTPPPSLPRIKNKKHSERNKETVLPVTANHHCAPPSAA